MYARRKSRYTTSLEPIVMNMDLSTRLVPVLEPEPPPISVQIRKVPRIKIIFSSSYTNNANHASGDCALNVRPYPLDTREATSHYQPLNKALENDLVPRLKLQLQMMIEADISVTDLVDLLTTEVYEFITCIHPIEISIAPKLFRQRKSGKIAKLQLDLKHLKKILHQKRYHNKYLKHTLSRIYKKIIEIKEAKKEHQSNIEAKNRKFAVLKYCKNPWKYAQEIMMEKTIVSPTFGKQHAFGYFSTQFDNGEIWNESAEPQR